jgi:diketogulonate reductase-like aldo/keto reductase
MIRDIRACARLNNGLDMPWLGLGVWQMNDGREVEEAIHAALEYGYRSIDTAAVYGNERGVGQAIRSSGILRKDIFLTTKVWNRDQRDKRILPAFEESLVRLETDYVDLYLVHWPVKGHYQETWEEMEKIYETGRAKAIGVSNFMIHHLEDILSNSSTTPAVNQVEFHPHLLQPELLSYCLENQIQVEAWSPLMQGQIMEETTILQMAEKYNRTAAQLVLRWNLQHEVVTIPKSIKPERIEENSKIFDFEISQDDMKTIDKLDRFRRVGPDPEDFNF